MYIYIYVFELYIYIYTLNIYNTYYVGSVCYYEVVTSYITNLLYKYYNINVYVVVRV